jgi:large subunit ribosomal protein L10
VLYGRLVGMVASPLTGLAAAMGGLIGGLARQLQAIADQGLVGQGAPTPAPAADQAAPEPAGEPEASAEEPAPTETETTEE